jgi:hypothetical protein
VLEDIFKISCNVVVVAWVERQRNPTFILKLLGYATLDPTYKKSNFLAVSSITNYDYSYQFICLQQSKPSLYQIMPELNLMESQRAIELLQVLKAICQL